MNLQNDRLLVAVTQRHLTRVLDEKTGIETLFSAMLQIA